MPAKDEQFMARALELARRGRGAVEPNPMVGAVIVRDGKVLGEGWHERFGGPHAEVQAIAAARSAGSDPAGATIYVTLEPCSRHGKTPPCTLALIEAGIARVVVAMEDPDAKVLGKGLQALRKAGMEVTVGVMADEARRLLAAYTKLRTKGRPWVICKWAQSLDGKIATRTGSSKWITGPAARQRVHEIRGLCDGVCVGAGTVLADDPLLTNRSGSGNQPARLILDEKLEISPDCRLMRSTDVSPVIVATRQGASSGAVDGLTRAGAEVIAFAPCPSGGIDLPAMLEELGRREWTYLLVEGGRGLHGSIIGQRLADELLVFIAPRIIGGTESIGPVDWKDIDGVEEAMRLPQPRVEPIGDDVMLRYVLSR